MTGPVGPGRPPVGSRFQKGQSGNPKGRPRSRPGRAASAFDVVIDRTLRISQGGQTRELTVEEALQHKTYHAAIGGNRAARREVLKMIAKREKWLAAKAPTHAGLEVLREHKDPGNANEALLLLDVAERDGRDYGPNNKYERLLLQPWVVEVALKRLRRRLTTNELAEVQRCTRDRDSIRWPAARDDGQQ